MGICALFPLVLFMKMLGVSSKHMDDVASDVVQLESIVLDLKLLMECLAKPWSDEAFFLTYWFLQIGGPVPSY